MELFIPIQALTDIFLIVGSQTRGEGVLHYGVRRGFAPVLGSFWPENSEIRIYFYWKISVIGLYFHLEFSGIGVYRYTQNSGSGC